MKKNHFILIPLILLGYLAGKSYTPDTEAGKQKTDSINENRSDPDKIKKNTSERIKQTLNCKSCHSSEYPVKNDPGLLNCPRSDMISVYHSPAEGPETVVIDEMSDYYNGVVFSHKVHSEMSEMAGGCTGCHHYNTTGPVMNCRKCHESSRSREEISIPDLKAAYHRQCMTCHKQWSSENGCNKQCHTRKGSIKVQSIDSMRGKSRPQLTLPGKLVWETRSKVNKTVTFFHDEHIKLFKINCISCHNQESCINCHASKVRGDYNKLIKIEKSVEDHHKPCINCHEGNSCQKCHTDKEMTSFNHGKSGGWVLKSYHSNLDCSKCHGNNMPYKKLNNKCASCHKNFTSAFNHSLIGFVFSENHSELECNNCHTGGDFTKNPSCTDCHDDKPFPSEIPGKKK